MNDEGRRHSAPATSPHQPHAEDSRSVGDPPPAIVVRFELERRPVVLSTAQHERDQQRLLAWLNSRERYAHLVAEAIDLAQQGLAA
jgi:hypothetical protein